MLSPNPPIRILFLASNPTDTTRLRLDEESREIGDRIRRAEFRDKFELIKEFAVRPEDLTSYLLQHKPHIVHFSGHGNSQSEIMVEDQNGQAVAIPVDALQKLFSILKDNIRCVVLNACYSDDQARAIAEEIDCVIGMAKPINDDDAVIFAAEFYQGLAYGKTIQSAFDLGKVGLALSGSAGDTTPQLITRLGIDPAVITLVSPPQFSAYSSRILQNPIHTLLNESFDSPSGLVAFSSEIPSSEIASRAKLATLVSLRNAISDANSELLAYEDQIVGIHLERPEIDQILDWCQFGPVDQRFAMLTDQPGGGKTVVMQNILKQLLTRNISVLALKCDLLGEIHSSEELANRYHLPLSIEECIRSLVSVSAPFVVLIDQLDALSITLSRNQATLDTLFAIMAHLRSMEGLKILASCRAFDLHTDPRLSTIKVDRYFQLSQLNDEAVDQVLHKLGVNAQALLPVQRKLLTVPLHLHIYAQIIVDNPGDGPLERFQNLHELYGVLWRKRIETHLTSGPSPDARRSFVYSLVDSMQSRRQTIVPVAAVEQYAEAAQFLEHEAFVRREGQNYLFLHQTLFDYAFARRFHAQGESLKVSILSSPQGFFERSKMVQVLTYLRGVDRQVYETEFQALLFSDNLRTHLRLLLISWFGGLTSPTEYEVTLARKLIADNANNELALFVAAVKGNQDWYACLKQRDIPLLLNSNDNFKIDQAINLLSSYFDHFTAEVGNFLRPYIERNADWNRRILFCLSRLKNWQEPIVFELLIPIVQDMSSFDQYAHIIFSQLAHLNPCWGCEVLQIYLDIHLDYWGQVIQQKNNEEPGSQDFLIIHNLLSPYWLGELVAAATTSCPDKTIEYLLPWLIRAANLSPHLALTTHGMSSMFDVQFTLGWYDQHLSESAEFARHLSEAMVTLARSTPIQFRTIAHPLKSSNLGVIHRILLRAYLSYPQEYASDSFDYLMDKFQWITVFTSTDIDEMFRLPAAIFPYLNQSERDQIETKIMSTYPRWEMQSPQRVTGATQLRFLRKVPPDLLSKDAIRRLRELERAFPNYQEPPLQIVTGGAVVSPIAPDAISKMTDGDWISAISKYDDSRRWGASSETFMVGGVSELASEFKTQVQANPQRFSALISRLAGKKISQQYVSAALIGVANSTAPSDMLYDLIRTFQSEFIDSTRQIACTALLQRAGEIVPEDILTLLIDWAIYDPDPTYNKELDYLNRVKAKPAEYNFSNPIYGFGVNSTRGAAVHAVSLLLLNSKPMQLSRLTDLIQRFGQDPTNGVRACALECLCWLANAQPDVSFIANIFESIVQGFPLLLRSLHVYELLKFISVQEFDRSKPFIALMLADADARTRQLGARLACISSLYQPQNSDLVEVAIQGDDFMRKGAAEVYAGNLSAAVVEQECQRQLIRLMNDPDKQVRDVVGTCFRRLDRGHLDRLRPFIKQFIDSLAIETPHDLIDFFLTNLPLQDNEYILVLEFVERILLLSGNKVTDISTSLARIDSELIKLIIYIQNHADENSPIRSRAMNSFEKMLTLASNSAQNALSEWDENWLDAKQ